MSHIFKVSGYLVEGGRTFSKESLASILELSTDAVMQQLYIEQADVDPRDDKVYQENCDLAECEKYFKSKPTHVPEERIVKIGAVYRHFKGNRVKVIAVAENTECLANWAVVYICLDEYNRGSIWFRPYDMFLSEVDRKKYPNAKQKYRFEMIDEGGDANGSH